VERSFFPFLSEVLLEPADLDPIELSLWPELLGVLLFGELEELSVEASFFSSLHLQQVLAAASGVLPADVATQALGALECLAANVALECWEVHLVWALEVIDILDLRCSLRWASDVWRLVHCCWGFSSSLVLSVLPDTEVCFEDVDVFFFLFFLCFLWYGVVILTNTAAGITLSQRVIVLVLGVLLFHRLLFSLSSSLSLDIKTLGPCMEAWSTLLVYAVSTIHQLYHSGSECLVMRPLLSVLCCEHL
jgi:hypothetical protein